MITTGVVGRPWRASITPWGAVLPWDDEPALNWYVAADDRWHVPAEETAVRQRRVEGTPVTETRVRVPNGDVVQRVTSVADAGGLTVIEVANESSLPVAVAFDRRGVLTERPIADVPIEGIELPRAAFVQPIGHGATVRIALPHGRRSDERLPSGLPGHEQVVRGWLATTERASRFELPDGASGSASATRVTAERCEVALGVMPTVDDDAAGFAIALGELVRSGEPPEPWMPELVDAVERLGPDVSWDADVALEAAARVLVVADERRARADLARIVATRASCPAPTDPPSGVRIVPWLEQRLGHRGALLPAGLPAEWLGSSFEAHGVPTGPASSVSFAVRWHGDRPAVLWEQAGEPIELTAPVVAPGWTTSDASGEALWPAPPTDAPPAPSGAEPSESPSFS